MGYLGHIHKCNNARLEGFRPFVIAGRRVGWVGDWLVAKLDGFRDVFTITDEAVTMSASLADPASRTQAMRRVLERLAADGTLPHPRGEDYPVAEAFARPPLLLIDRAVVAQFGIRAYGVHVNGYVRTPDGVNLWIGRRAKDKSVAPGKLDNMVAGGQPAGLTLAENLAKEAEEEAGIPRALAARARPVGVISYLMRNEAGIKPDVLFCYDLEMPADFTPTNRDGEISEFMLMPLAEVARRVRDGDDFKFNVNLVIVDFLIRHGHITPENEPDYIEIVRGLHDGAAGEK